MATGNDCDIIMTKGNNCGIIPAWLERLPYVHHDMIHSNMIVTFDWLVEDTC